MHRWERAVIVLLLGSGMAARADCSYTGSTKSSCNVDKQSTTRYYLKGALMRIDDGDKDSIIDMAARTWTLIDNAQKHYVVTRFDALPDALRPSGVVQKINLKETGQTRRIHGYNTARVLLTKDVALPHERGPDGKGELQMESW